MTIRTHIAFATAIVPFAFAGCMKPEETSTEMNDVEYNMTNIDDGNVPETNSPNPTADEPGDVEANADAGAGSFDSSEESEMTDEAMPAPPPGSGCNMPRHVLLQVLWGNLGGRPNPPYSTFWGGKLVAQGGLKMQLVKTILFERNDAINPPILDGVSWTSETRPHYDGVLVAIGIPASGEGTVAFYTPPLTTTFTAEELVRLNKVVEIDQYNAVSFRAMPAGRCPHGFLRGHWKRVDSKGGTFRGKWTGPQGGVKGFIEGIWGVSSSGKNVFYGRFISMRGRIHGRVSGTYGDGKFHGVWTRHGMNRGVIRGHYSDGAVAGDGRGFFGGEWIKFCAANRRCQAEVTASGFVSADATNANDMAFEVSGNAAIDASVSVTCTAE